METPDINTIITDRHLAKQARQEDAFERLSSEFLDDIITGINDLLDTAQGLSLDYEGYDFREETAQFIKDGVEL